MSQRNRVDRRRKLTLFLKREQPESLRALELVRAYDSAVEVIYIDNGNDRLVPSLHTPLSAFEGLPDIEAFLAAEQYYPVVRNYLRTAS